MAIHKKSSLNFRNRRPRWECESVQLLANPIESTEWKYVLETVARELYDLSHQLQETHEVVQATESSESNRSYSLHHPGETETPTPVATRIGEDGASNGKDPQHAA
jgi:hypothetical protein